MSRRLPKPRAPRGLTLIELMVSLGVGILACGLALMAFASQQASFQSVDVNRQTSVSARDVTLELETTLRRAGWGVDPRYAFDFTSYNCPAGTAPCRDRTNGPDQLVFIARNPYYQWQDIGQGGCGLVGGCYTGNAWRLVSTAANTITLTLGANDVLRTGRVLQITCPNGQNATMATVASPANGPGTVTVNVLQAVAGNPYRENAYGGTCFSQAGAAVFLVDRYRYSVRTYNGTPWLVLDTGIDLDGDNLTAENDADPDDYVPVAAGVEELQFAYLLTAAPATFGYAAPDNNATWTFGDNKLVNTPDEPNPAVTAPTYNTSSVDITRFNAHPANIRAVRFTAVVRSLRRDPGKAASFIGDPAIFPENRAVSATPVAGGFRRVRVTSDVNVRNLDSRSPFVF